MFPSRKGDQRAAFALHGAQVVDVLITGCRDATGSLTPVRASDRSGPKSALRRCGEDPEIQRTGRKPPEPGLSGVTPGRTGENAGPGLTTAGGHTVVGRNGLTGGTT